MNLLVLNSGSSSVKFQWIQMPKETALVKGLVENVGQPGGKIKVEQGAAVSEEAGVFPGHEQAVACAFEQVRRVVPGLAPPDAIAHRVVHGGEKYRSAALVNDQVVEDIRSLSELAPLHNPANLAGIEACRKLFPGAPQAAVFDTAFHQTLPPKAYLYGLPYELYEKYRIRKYGFHGISHKYVSKQAMEVLEESIKDFKILSCHLGSGASICAIKDGKSVEISMGFTPMEGLMMGTRAGSFDPEIVLFLLRKGYSVEGIEEMMQKKGGLKGISESSDVRELREDELSGGPKSELAFEMFVYRVQRFISSYTAALGGLDVLIFTGGVGEKAYYLRRRICQNLGYLGIQLDMKKNRANEEIISSADSRATVLVIPTNEELEIARESYPLLRGVK